MKIIAVALAVIFTVTSEGRPLKDVRFTGEGCPKESTDVVMTEDGQTISVLFSKFKAEVGGSTGKETARIVCNIEIPIDIPKGMGLGVFKLDYRGYTVLPKRAKALLDVEYDLGPHRSPKFQKHFNNEKKGDFDAEDRLPPEHAAKSIGCNGEDPKLKLRAFITVDTNKEKEQAVFMLDSADGTMKGGLHYRMKVAKCR